MLLTGKVLVEFQDPHEPLDTVDGICILTDPSGAETEAVCFGQSLPDGSIQHIVPSPEAGPFHELFLVDLDRVPTEFQELRFWCRYYPSGHPRPVPWTITRPDSMRFTFPETGDDDHFVINLDRIPAEVTTVTVSLMLSGGPDQEITAIRAEEILAASHQAPFTAEGPRLVRRGQGWHLIEPTA